MAKQIKRSEIAEQDLYKEIRDSAEQTIEYIEYLNDSLKDTAKVLSKELKKPLQITMEGISNVNQSVEVMNDTMQESLKLDKAKAQAVKAQADAQLKLEKLEQERIKTQLQENKLAQDELKMSKQQQKQDRDALKVKKQLADLEDDQVKAKIRFQKANAEQKKILADELILQDKQAGTLEKLAAQNRKLRREREKLNLETEEGKKRLKEINDELDDNNEVIKENSDALKKQKLNVGNYTESIEQATGELGGMIKGIKESIDGIKNQAKAFMVQAKAADTSAKKIRLIGKAVKASGIAILITMLGSLVSSMGDTREGVLNLQGTMAKAQATMTMFGQKVMDWFQKIGLQIEKAKLGLTRFLISLEDVEFFGKKPFEGVFLDEKEKADAIARLKEIDAELAKIDAKDYSIGDVFEAIDETIKKGFAFEDLLAKTSDEIERLRGQEELLSEQAGDMTISFDQQRKAQAEYNKVVEKRIGLESDLAKANVDLQALKIRESLLKAGKNYSIEQIKNLEFLDDENASLKINSDTLAELIDAKKEVIAIDNEKASALAKNAMEARNTAKDDFEKELDYAIDAFDYNKSINERIINNEKTTLAEREALTEETRAMADSAFANQVKLVQDYTKKRIDFDKLLAMTDEAEIRRTLRKYQLNETTLTRILEILKERKIVVQDLADLEDETAQKRVDKNRAILESEQNIEQDNFDLKVELLEKEFDVQRDLRQKSYDDETVTGQESIKKLKNRLDEIKAIQIKQLKDQAAYDRQVAEEEIVEEDEKAAKIKEINEKLANDIIRLEEGVVDKKKDLDDADLENKKKKADKEKELAKEAAEQRAEDQVAILEALTDASIALADKRIAKIDEEIAASERRYDSLAALAASGNILAKESMAEEAKLMAEQNRKREQMERRKQRIQLASTVLETYLTNSQDPDVKNPLQKTITDTVLLTEFIKSLPMFFDGTEDTGKNGQGVDGKGGFLSILHPNERVIPKKNNELIGNMSNDDLAQLAYNYQNGLVRDVADGLTLSNDLSGVKVLADKLDSLERTISNKPEHNIQLEQIVDGAMAISRTTKRGNTKIYNRYRIG